MHENKHVKNPKNEEMIVDLDNTIEIIQRLKKNLADGGERYEHCIVVCAEVEDRSGFQQKVSTYCTAQTQVQMVKHVYDIMGEKEQFMFRLYILENLMGTMGEEREIGEPIGSA